MGFNEWLMQEKGFSLKVSHDIASRLKRVQKFLDTDKIHEGSLSGLEAISEFKDLSMSVKSQLRRAIRLYNEFQAKQ